MPATCDPRPSDRTQRGRAGVRTGLLTSRTGLTYPAVPALSSLSLQTALHLQLPGPGRYSPSNLSCNCALHLQLPVLSDPVPLTCPVTVRCTLDCPLLSDTVRLSFSASSTALSCRVCSISVLSCHTMSRQALSRSNLSCRYILTCGQFHPTINRRPQLFLS